MVAGITGRQLMRQRPHKGGDADVEIVFTHALIQDVAYAQIRRVDRAAKHERTAESMSSRVADGTTYRSSSPTTTGQRWISVGASATT